ncbi:hypothetical protein JCM30204_28030 [Dysgonomonas termitidis]|uniref:Uncharacterized protein n=1 Tax=Dysgonomonas termitidis TaxID=1516126 RepID=A0ABV9KUU7_9BACT
MLLGAERTAPFAQSYCRGLVEVFPPLIDNSNKDYIRKWDALIAYFFKIQFPEELTDEQWAERVKQLEWLAKRGILGMQHKKGLI